MHTGGGRPVMWLLLSAGISLGGQAQAAQEDEIAACEARLVASLLSPSSYRRIGLTESGGVMYFEYDASNAFGALLRGHYECAVVPAADGRRFADDPAVVATSEERISDCEAKYDQQVKTGQLSQRHRAIFAATCPQEAEAPVASFMLEMLAAKIHYPLPP